MKKLISLLLSNVMLLSAFAIPSVTYAAAEDDTEYAGLLSPAAVYNMNIDWKFKKASEDNAYPLAAALQSVSAGGKNFYEPDYDDSGWETVSVPHAPNSEDSFDGLGLDAGEASLFRGFMFYRKNISIPQKDIGKKLFLEFEAFRQSVYLYVNGDFVGYYEAGIAPVGFDITDKVNADGTALIAVATDNSASRGNKGDTKETRPGSEPGAADGYGYQWNSKDFNEVQGGITGNVNLYAKNEIYQTLPLYNNLKTTGNYIYADNFDLREGSADIHVKAEVRNESGADRDIRLLVDVVDGDGRLVGEFESQQNVPAAEDSDARFASTIPADAYDYAETERNSVDISTVDVTYIDASASLAGLHLWSDVSPYLYDVYTYLLDGNTVIDAQKTKTGFRSVEYNKDDGLLINGTSTYLKGYAQRSTNEWAAIGVANDWLTDIDMQLIKESNANMIRWMHIAPNPVDVRGGDKYGVISICPAGDKEGDSTGRTWDQRLEAMRDVIIYFRNSPSVLFWEAGNEALTPDHMRAMTELRKALDPTGGRFMGSRTISSVDQIREAEWVGTMLYRHGTNAYNSMKTLNKFMPIVETEFHRNESPRRIWDDYSPPYYDYVNKWLGNGGTKTDGYDIWDQTQEDFAQTMFRTEDGYSYFYDNRVGGSGKNEYSGAAMMVWSDSNMHVRNCGVENARSSGRVDPIRIKKESFYAIKAAQSEDPEIFILGHWNYPALTDETYNYEDKTFNGTYWEPNGTILKRDPTNKTVYVIGSRNLAKVELYVNDELKGTDTTPTYNYIYAFDGIDVTQSGKVSAKAYNERGEVVAEHEIKTVGEPARIRLTPVTGPDGLRADGSDLMYVDVEIVDEDGNVCPLDERKISFSINDESVADFVGGYNSGYYSDGLTGPGGRIVNQQSYVFAECGINRVFIRSTRKAGSFTLTASAEGLQNVSLELSSEDFTLTGGLTEVSQQSFRQGEVPPPPAKQSAPALRSLGNEFTAVWDGEGKNVITVNEDTKDYYTVRVNGTEVTGFTDRPYKPDSSTGVIGELTPVLDAVKAAGASVTYTTTTEGVKPSYMIYGDLPYITINSGDDKIETPFGSTNLFINEEVGGLMNWAISKNSSGNDLVVELGAVIGGIAGVTVQSNEAEKTLDITVTEAPLSVMSADDDPDIYDHPAALYISNEIINTYGSSPSVSYEGGQIKITSGSAISGAQLITAGYSAEGLLSSIRLIPLDMAADTTQTYSVDESVAACSRVAAMIWDGTNSMIPLCEAIKCAEKDVPDETPTPAVPGKIDDIYKYDTVKAYNPCDTEMTGTHFGDGTSPDGTSYLTATADTAVADIGEDTMLDALWEIDLRFDNDGAGVTPRNKANNFGTCIRRYGNMFSIETGSNGAHTEYFELDPETWYHVALLGRYSAPDADITMFVYKYTESGLEPVGEWQHVNMRNLYSNNKAGARRWDAHPGTSVDNARITLLGADTLYISSDNGAESIKAGNSLQFGYSATRQGEYITPPDVVWEIYNAANTAPLGDDSISVSSSGVVTAALNAAEQDITVRATAESGIYASKRIHIDGVDLSDAKFDSITLEADRDYVSVNEPLTIRASATLAGADVELSDGDLIWYCADSNDLQSLGDTKWISVTNGVVTVDPKAISQDIRIRAADPTDSVRGSIPVHIKSSDALEGNESGAMDSLLFSDNCEAAIANASFETAPDGTHAYHASSGFSTGYISETSDDLVIELDIRFGGEGAGFTPSKNGKYNSCVRYHDGDLCVQTGGSSYTKLVQNISTDKWYHITLIRKQGDLGYAHMIFEEYNENGERINKTLIKDVNQRNNEATAWVNIETNTSFDNLRVLSPLPDKITVSTDVRTVFAGGTVQASSALFWKELEMKNPDSSMLAYRIYDADDLYPIDDGSVTVDGTGTISVSSMAATGDYHVRAVCQKNSEVYASAKFSVESSDVLKINTLGVNEDGSRLINLNVSRDFYYDPDYEVTFVTELISSDGVIKEVFINRMYGDALTSGENIISLGIDIPAWFDKESDTIKIYPVTKLSVDTVSEPDSAADGISAEANSNTVTLNNNSGVPVFDDDSAVLVLITKPDADETAITADDILWFGRLGNGFAGGETIICSENVGAGCAVKLSGTKNGVHTIRKAVIQ